MRRILKIGSLAILLGIAFWNPLFAQSEFQSNTIVQMAWSPLDDKIVFADFKPSTQVWDVATRKLLFQLENHTAAINGLGWSPDGTKLVTASDVTAQVWNASTGQPITTISDGLDILSIAWTSDSQQVLTGMDAVNVSPPLLRRWNALTGELLYKGSAGAVLISFSPNDQLLTLDPGLFLELRDAKTFSYINQLLVSTNFEQNNEPSAIAWSPDSQTIVAGYLNGMIRIWNVKTSTVALEVKANESAFQPGSFVPSSVVSVTYNLDGSELYSVSADGTVRGWNVNTKRLLFDEKINNRIFTATWSPYKARVALSLIHERHEISLSKNQVHTFLADGRILIITPTTSLNNLKNVAVACLLGRQASELTTQPLVMQQLSSFVQMINQLFNTTNPSECVADIKALLHALNNT